jgi:hypothetical protein
VFDTILRGNKNGYTNAVRSANHTTGFFSFFEMTTGQHLQTSLQIHQPQNMQPQWQLQPTSHALTNYGELVQPCISSNLIAGPNKPAGYEQRWSSYMQNMAQDAYVHPAAVNNPYIPDEYVNSQNWGNMVNEFDYVQTRPYSDSPLRPQPNHQLSHQQYGDAYTYASVDAYAPNQLQLQRTRALVPQQLSQRRRRARCFKPFRQSDQYTPTRVRASSSCCNGCNCHQNLQLDLSQSRAPMGIGYTPSYHFDHEHANGHQIDIRRVWQSLRPSAATVAVTCTVAHTAAQTSATAISTPIASCKQRRKRRKIEDLQAHEVWTCPTGCGKKYRKTSTVSFSQG